MLQELKKSLRPSPFSPELLVANSILHRTFEEGVDVSPMKLQKLTYFLYKKFLQDTEEALFGEYFEVWQYGPVLPSLYHAYRAYRANPITDYVFIGKPLLVADNYMPFHTALNFVCGLYMERTGMELSKITHREGTAWHKARERNELYIADEDIAVEAWMT